MAIRHAPAALLVPLLLGLATTAQAVGVYQWKDAKGITHYADAPPPRGVFHSRDMTAPPAPAATQPAAAPVAPVKPTAESNCTIARSNLDRLKSTSPIGPDADGDGKPDSVMSDSERTSQLALAERNIASYCVAAPALPAP